MKEAIHQGVPGLVEDVRVVLRAFETQQIPICKIYKNFKLQFMFTVTVRIIAAVVLSTLRSTRAFYPQHPQMHLSFQQFEYHLSEVQSITIVMIVNTTARLNSEPTNFTPGLQNSITQQNRYQNSF